MTKRLTATSVLNIAKKRKKNNSMGMFKPFVKNIIDAYGMEKNDAFVLLAIIRKKDVLQALGIMAKYEGVTTKNE